MKTSPAPGTLLSRGLIGIAFLASVLPAQAGLFSITPVRIFMSPRDRAAAVTIVNESDEPLAMQAEAFRWGQKPGGEEDLQPTEDVILSPPILKLAPRARQVVRLALLKPQSNEAQSTYRLVVREVPDALAAGKELKVQIALAFSLPVFVTPPSARRQMTCSLGRTGGDSVRADCENIGRAYAQPREYVLTSASGQRLASHEAALYILPSIRRSTELRRTDGSIPAGPAKLTLTFDDGSTQAFELTVPD